MSGVLLAAAVLATWRVTHLVAAEDGPWDVIARLLARAPGPVGRLMDCFYCLSLWVAVPAAILIGPDWFVRGLAWPAISGGAILLERLTASRSHEPEGRT